MQDVAFMGRARSGKDTAGAFLMGRHGYKRLALADPLKVMALDIDPVIPTGHGGTDPVRLSLLVRDVGWEYAKTHFPEVRRILQNVGQANRDRDPDYWLRFLMTQIDGARGFGYNVVVTDVRYPNEAVALREIGFKLIRIERPAMQRVSVPQHISETALDDFAPHVHLINDSTPEALAEQLDRHLAE